MIKRLYHHKNHMSDATCLLYNIKKVKADFKHFNNVPLAFQKEVLKTLPKDFFSINTLNHFDLKINDVLFYDYFTIIYFM